MDHPDVATNLQAPIDSLSVHDHSSIKKSRGGKPKLFQCTGYGDCRMVFTRSEHLARHMRKHTGEKPFKCVVPGCNRMFSRFDNMMQHTQTHNKARSTSRGPKTDGGKSKDKRSSEHSLSDADSNYDQSGLPSPPPSRRGTKDKTLYKARIRQKRQLQRKNYAENYDDEDEDDDDMDELEYGDSEDDTDFHNGKHDYSDDSDSDASYSMYGYYGDYRDGNTAIAEQRAMFAEMRRSSHDGYTLPPPVPNPSFAWPNALTKTMVNNDSIWQLPSIQAPIPLVPGSSSSRSYPHQRHSESPLSSASATTDSSHTPCKRQRMAPKVQFHPYPYRRHSTTADGRYVLRPLYQKEEGDVEHTQGDDAHMILPRIATYLMAHPDEPPENYLLHHHYQHQSDHQQSPLHQKRAMTWPTLPGTEKVMTRRLSVQDLCNPIECLDQSSVVVKETNMANDNSCNNINNAEPEPIKQEEGVDLTLDEYEAIQGFGRFQKCGTLK